MRIFKRLTGEFIDNIEWNDDSNNTIVHRHQRYADEIKDGARLTVRESQLAVFMYEGEVVKVVEPGSYELETDNIPFVTTLENIHRGMKSPSKGEIYFCSMRQFVDMKWGTKRPITIRDSEFGAIRLRAFGNYSFRLHDPVLILRELSGTNKTFTTDNIQEQLRTLISSRFTSLLGQSKIPVLDLAAGVAQLEEYLTSEVATIFSEYGFELTNLFIENISLPEIVENALDAHLLMGIAASPNFYKNPYLLKFFSNKGDGAPPSLHTTMAGWYIDNDEEIDSPLQTEEVVQLILQNKITPTTLVWRKGMKNWLPAEKTARLKPFFDNNRKHLGKCRR